MTTNAIPLLLGLSVVINILFIWYLRNLLTKFVYVSENIYDLKTMVEIYQNHLEVVSELEMNGYVTRPHSSAGSIPARKAYRLYVEALGSVNEMMLSSKLRRKVRHQLIQSVSNDINTWGSTAVNLLSNLVGSLAIVTAPQSFQLYVNQIHVIKIQNTSKIAI